jgi:hypothetical protein
MKDVLPIIKIFQELIENLEKDNSVNLHEKKSGIEFKFNNLTFKY